MSTLSITQIARICHEANKAFCEELGDLSQNCWEYAPEWQRTSIQNGVAFNLANPDASPSASHDNWLAEKLADGWVYGPVKDPEKKEHPCCVPYDELPAEQKAKYAIFKGIVNALAAIHAEPEPTDD